MCEFHIPLQAPRPPQDPEFNTPIWADIFGTPVQSLLTENEIMKLKLMHPKDPEFEEQRGIGRVRIAAQQILLNATNNLKRNIHILEIINDDKTNSKPYL